MRSQPLMFSYLGRRGAMPQFTLEVARAAERAGLDYTVCVSRQNELYDTFQEFGRRLVTIETFTTVQQALVRSWGLPRIRSELQHRIARDGIRAVIELMPHVWSPAIAPAVRAAGARYCAIVHDAERHDGDRSSRAKMLHDLALPHADILFTLSQSVAGQLVVNRSLAKCRILPLFHPDLYAGEQISPLPWRPGQRIKLLFFGRILRYKGLPLFLDSIEVLRDYGVDVEAGVFGEGDLAPMRSQIDRLGVTVGNRWLSHAEIPAVFGQYHAVVLTHVEASQSGVAAAALGLGLPVVTTPVGGLFEQVEDGRTGIIASGADSDAVAGAVQRLFQTPGLYAAVREQIAQTRATRSMDRFVGDCVSQALHVPATALTPAAAVPRSVPRCG